jgi:4-amino-4-deoxy-L-arabinose transferase-like glycosyltransferase
MLALLALLALAIRFWQAGYHSLWFDETVSVFWARQPAREIIDVGLHLVRDKHPPVYYLLLRLWIGLFGDGTVAVRALSILFGAALPPLLAHVGAELGDRRAGLIAGLLATLNPILVWYSQEARMFLPATTIGVLATLCLLKALKQRSGLWWLGFILSSLAGFYMYLFYAFLLTFHGALALAWIVWIDHSREGHRIRQLIQTLIAFSILGALLLPLGLQALAVSGAESQAGRPFAHVGPTLWSLLQKFTWHLASPASPWGIVIALAALGLLILGLAAPPRSRRLATALWVLIPLAAGNLFIALDRTVFAETRYFLFLAPALCLAWGSSLAWLSRRFRRGGLIPLAIWLLVPLLALPANWAAENRREDWRAAAEYVATHAGPGDAILIHPAFVHVAFEYYDRSGLPIFYPFQGDVESHEQIDAPLRGLDGYATVWLITSHDAEPDPQHLVQRWFEDQFPLVTEQFPTGIGVRGYAVTYQFSELPGHAPPADAAWANSLRLAGYAIDQTRLPATDDQYHPPSNWIHATLYWQIDRPLHTDISIGLKLVDEWGQVWGDRLYRAGELLNRYPTSQWQVGEIVRTDFDVNLNPVTPAGVYRLELALYDPAGQPWLLTAPVAGSAQIDLSTIQVVEE